VPGNLPEATKKTHLSNCRLYWVLISALGGSLIFATQARPDLVSSLYTRGYTVIPEPQQVKLEGDDLRLTAAWRLELGRGVEANSVAVEALKDGLEERPGSKRNLECSSMAKWRIRRTSHPPTV